MLRLQSRSTLHNAPAINYIKWLVIIILSNEHCLMSFIHSAVLSFIFLPHFRELLQHSGCARAEPTEHCRTAEQLIKAAVTGKISRPRLLDFEVRNEYRRSV